MPIIERTKRGVIGTIQKHNNMRPVSVRDKFCVDVKRWHGCSPIC